MSEPITRFLLQRYESPRAGTLALVSIDDGAGPRRPPTLGRESLESLDGVLDRVEREDFRGLLVTGKPFHFAAGADLDAFVGASGAFAREAGERGHRAFARIRNLEMPSLAAIGGACLGGGLELALHCSARTLSTAAPALGFPEVFLSIVPGWGGTQLAPRLVGGPTALRVLVHDALERNRTLSAEQAFELGFADRLLAPVDFLEQSLTWLEDLAVGEDRIERRAPSDEGLDEALENARAFAEEKVHGATAAPARAIELIEFAARGGALDVGLAREEEVLEELLPADAAQASVYAFDLTQRRVKRQPGRPDVEPRAVRKVAVLGAGTMGAQLGAAFLRRLEVPLVLKDVDESVLEQARRSVRSELDAAVEKGRIPEGRARFLASLVTTTTRDDDLAGSDFVLEAVLEDLELKQRLFGELEDVVDEDCILATNTSSLSVTAMGRDLEHPERLIGFHFFNPVKVLPLVEVACPSGVDDAVVSTAFEVAGKLGKRAVRCADAPAFVVNRVLLRFMGPCLRAATRGAAFREVDRAIEAIGLPMGPFELLGLVGPEIAWHTLQSLHEAFPDRFELDRNLERLAESGRGGVYGANGEVDEAVRRDWEVDLEDDVPGPQEIRRSALEAIADEVRRLLDDGVVGDARDVDTCLLLGAGWPFFTGGICRHLDQSGISQKLFGAPLIGPDAAEDAA